MKITSNNDDISSALSHLTDTLEGEKERLNEEVAQAMKDGEYDTAIQSAQRLLGFQSEVEALIEKWEGIEEARDGAALQVQQIVSSRPIHRKRPEVDQVPRRNSYRGITASTAHCFHILDIIEEMGGVARMQDMMEAVNKRIQMLNNQFKSAKNVMAQQGWTKNTGSKLLLEISSKGTKWLQSQKAQIVDKAVDTPERVTPKSQDAPPPAPSLPAPPPPPPVEDDSGPFI